MSVLRGAWDVADAYLGDVLLPSLIGDGLFNLCLAGLCTALLALGLVVRRQRRSRDVYVLDFAVFQPKDQDFVMNNSQLLRVAMTRFGYSAPALNFMRRVAEKAGLGHETYMPLSFKAYDCTITTAREEAETVIFGAIDELFEKTGISPQQIGCIITNCSLFCPTPSLSSMIVNHYGFDSSVKTFSLGGMGCSASMIGLDLGRMVMHYTPGLVLLISTENMTLNFYRGENRSMLLQNILFRMGCSAVLLSPTESFSLGRGRTLYAKYRLKDLVRTHHGASDDSYRCVYQTTDDAGVIGVSIGKTVPKCAGKALQENMITVFKRNLPPSEVLRFLVHSLWRRGLGYKLGLCYDIVEKDGKPCKVRPAPFKPVISRVFDHLCFHTGGRGVLDEMEHLLNLNEEQMAASRATLFRYGNTSSSSVWYELAYHESTHAVRPGSRVWQISFGSGFKCNSAIWVATRHYRSTIPTIFDHQDPEYTWSKAKEKPYALEDDIQNMIFEDSCQVYRDEQDTQEYERFCAKFHSRLEQDFGLAANVASKQELPIIS
ncbi:3-ketoacyl-CoA synthase [Giardia muris]|uniref:very-long-chain 3-oxoacyl-CoA synthase n=1 Tax=Giardia muris TaxID=5742 RepID=A0A4Z1T0D7_GIAMU|nr:3-ketoacyl-CoA synthase [Giardia muris]|eukprot:TNJ29168.1 3-ketoacyl-CoA synthase [Giardia muris]